MPNEFDRQKMLTNISTLIQQRGMKIGELETKVGVSAGYLSRLGKEESKAIPAIDVIWRIARELGVNIELLVDGNFDHATENLAYLQKFVQRLFEKTVTGALDWQAYSRYRMEQAVRGEVNLQIPFIETDPERTFTDDRSDLLQIGCDYSSITGFEHKHFVSFTWPGSTKSMGGSCFYTEISPAKRLYIAKFVDVMYEGADEYDPGVPDLVDWYEVVIEDMPSGHVEAICNTLNRCAPLLPDIEKLYQELKQHEYDLRIAPTVKRVIDDFMTADDLPF